jgi:transposase
MDTRELKGLQIAATERLRYSKTAGWTVPSQSGMGTYNVRQNVPESLGLRCTCPDFETRGRACKHVFAVEIVRKRENPDGSVLTETVRVTYSQDWTAYNAAQTEEKERFLPMLRDLCSLIENAPQGKGRPRMPMSDMAFAAVHRIHAGLSARRFDTDVREDKANGLTEADPHFNTVLRYLRSPEMTPWLRHLVEISALPLKEVETDFAVDSTGFSTSRFVRWYDHKWGKERVRQEWVKLHAMTGVRTNIVTAVELSGAYSNDTLYFRPTLATTVENGFTVRDMTADKAYSSKANLQAVEDIGGTPCIPFRGHIPAFNAVQPPLPGTMSIFYKMQHMFAYQRDTFLSHYHKRSNVETVFSMIKRKFGDSVRSKSEGNYSGPSGLS